ncbi:hypothetical protein SISNIDRAFT_452631 [Sistotremastrum niveocremeum HHB9708]|uniref:Phytanoyl-CoA dioxygenase n=1 Tax=Sistotremastrum niveocremeum HHB9708 TaxID=1314777 RepID=A0A164WQY0_9AGAM|nr:hypothetical protein SISNIDRAFT_452631 [Sistotremastrum niveocremeum HHB9708]
MVQKGLKARYLEDGYVILRNLVSEQEMKDLTEACTRAEVLVREAGWPFRRSVGKQFPPYSDEPDSWGIQHVMHPALGEPAFARWYSSDAICDVAKELLGCSEEDLQMELFNILINPERHDFALRWHRDDVKEDASESEEVVALNVSQYGIQWNTALYDDDCLFVVPGSHIMPRTAAQRVQSLSLDPPKDPLAMPGAIKVALKAGETVFYNQNILHCATYSPSKKRATLHACMGNCQGGSFRARNILQHDVSWMKGEVFRATLHGRAQKMWEKLIKMESEAGGTIVYSQTN